MVADARSLFIYIGSFLLSSGIALLYEHVKANKDSFLRQFAWINLIILFPVIIAGNRYNVGYDFFNYVRHFTIAENMSLKEIIATGSPVYYGFLWLLRKFLEVKEIFFVFSYLTLYLFVKALLKVREKISVSYVLLLYYFVFYAFSLNGVRQALSVSIIVLAAIYLFEGRYKSYAFCVAIATLIHSSAIVAGLFWFAKIIKSKTIIKIANKKYRISDITFTVVMASSTFFMPLIFLFVRSIVFNAGFFAKYQHLIGTLEMGYGILIYTIIVLGLNSFFYDVNDGFQRYLFLVGTIFFLLGNLGYLGNYTFRIRYYPYAMILMFAGYMLKKTKKHNEILGNIIGVYYFVIFIIHDFILETMYATDIFPYQSW